YLMWYTLCERSLYPANRLFHDVVALVEGESSAVRPERLEPDVPDLVVPGRARDHRVRVAAFGLDLGDELQCRSLSPERQLVDDASQPAVVMLVARIEHVDPKHHRRVVGP